MQITKIYPMQHYCGGLSYKDTKKESKQVKAPKQKESKFHPGFYKALFKIMPKKALPSYSLEAETFINNSAALKMYLNTTYEPKYYTDPFKRERTNALLNLSLKEAEETESACFDILKRTDEIGKQNVLPHLIKTLIDLRFFNKEAYEYALNSDYILSEFFAKEMGSYACVKNLTKASLIEIEKRQKNDYITAYVNNSDSFSKYDICNLRLDEFLSQNKTEGDMVVKRVERHTGIFNKVPLEDKNLIYEVRFANAANYTKTSASSFSGYTKSYFKAARKGKISIYEYIATKKDLSIADAMLVMPYLNKNAQSRLLEKIKGIKLYDDRFKSTTLSDKFVNIWLSSNENGQSQIENTITLEKGMEGRYASVPFVESSGNQFEFIINRGKKEMTIEDVSYNQADNIFYIKSYMKKA